MNPRVLGVKPENNYTLHLWFKNGEEGILNMKPYLDKGIFRAFLKNIFSKKTVQI
jgi:hypothetical protein